MLSAKEKINTEAILKTIIEKNSNLLLDSNKTSFLKMIQALFKSESKLIKPTKPMNLV